MIQDVLSANFSSFIQTKDYAYSKGSVIARFIVEFSSRKDQTPTAADIGRILEEKLDGVKSYSIKPEEEDDTWKIIVIVVSVVFFVLLLTLAVFYYLHRSGKLRDSETEYSSDSASESKDYSYEYDMKNKLFPRPQMRTWQTQEGMTGDQGRQYEDESQVAKEGPPDDHVVSILIQILQKIIEK